MGWKGESMNGSHPPSSLFAKTFGGFGHFEALAAGAAYAKTVQHPNCPLIVPFPKCPLIAPFPDCPVIVPSPDSLVFAGVDSPSGAWETEPALSEPP